MDINDLGICLGNTGQGNRAEEFYKRALRIYLDVLDWRNVSAVCQNLSEIYSLQGLLHQSVQTAGDAIEHARRAQEKFYEDQSLAYKAYGLYLLGEVAEAGGTFREAEELEKEEFSIKYLVSLRGILHTNFLNRIGEVDYARKVAEANLKICEQNSWPDDISRCHQVLGDLYANSGQDIEAAKHYRDALDISRSISHKLVLMEALLAKGRWEARWLLDPDAAFSDLNESLEYARAGGYRICEADIRVALAWAHLAACNKRSAQEEAEYARHMSEEMSYHWGKVDADEVLSALKGGGAGSRQRES